ncbi:molybdate ABC transporter substrate-binding protein [Capsulimonas corticalis]|uniref:Molybdate ABC transporter substrate-binding protein n=1 Tax=Capsulimonas corticalis TaxID=2219043 RepID=A0A402D572_9BACT|nr:molybdate ABC transporter substrate-binding protein [Capsulimonas corticalis]BDI29883.1 molybdate ABC transporter substrate-binding protein [Capsulimonas corticalis]
MRVKLLDGKLLGASAVLALMMTAGAARAQDLHVAAAANLQKVFSQAIVPAFEKQQKIKVVTTFGSTKLLATQIEQGLPADVFVAADTVTVSSLVAKGTLVAGTQETYAVGRLALWSRADAPNHPVKIQDLQDPKYAKIAIANPKLAPYGLAAAQSFANANLTASVTPRLVQAENIGQTLQYAQSGNADVALTALSLVIDDKKDPYVIVPDYLHAPIAQGAALVKRDTVNPKAAAFLAFLVSPAAKPIWKQYGYLAPVGVKAK